MDLLLSNFTDHKISKAFFEKILKAVEKKERVKKELSLELVLVGEKKMRNINKRYAGKNKVTSVLSFPFSEIKKPSKKELQFVEPQKEKNLLGEILLCPSRIKKQARRKKEDFKKELAFNSIHGFLHLLGYNHKKTEDTKEMRKKEKEIMKGLKF
jgi:probable rRNA maturation factor